MINDQSNFPIVGPTEESKPLLKSINFLGDTVVDIPERYCSVFGINL